MPNSDRPKAGRRGRGTPSELVTDWGRIVPPNPGAEGHPSRQRAEQDRAGNREREPSSARFRIRAIVFSFGGRNGPFLCPTAPVHLPSPAAKRRDRRTGEDHRPARVRIRGWGAQGGHRRGRTAPDSRIRARPPSLTSSGGRLSHDAGPPPRSPISPSTLRSATRASTRPPRPPPAGVWLPRVRLGLPRHARPSQFPPGSPIAYRRSGV